MLLCNDVGCDTSDTRLRLDCGHGTVNSNRRARARGAKRHSRVAERVAAGNRLRLMESDSPSSWDRVAPAKDRVLRRFRDSLHVLTRIARDPLVWHTEDGTVLTDLRETLHLTESALRQFESARTDAGLTLTPCDAILTLANLVQDRMDRLFERMECLTDLRQSLFRLGGILEAVSNDQVPRVHEIEEIATTVIDVTIQDGCSVTLLDPESMEPALRIAAHCINVAQVIVRLASSAPAWHRELPLAVGAALLMDLGMMRMPVEILKSTDLLSAPQRMLLHKHPEHSEAIVRRMQGMDERWADAARQHHERLDGSGYPDHVRAAEVGPVARLLAVADTYVGLQSPRVYRPALSARQALVEIDRAVVEGRLDPAWSCRLPEIETHWVRIPTAPEPPSSAPACSARAA
jgi:HD domain